MCWIYLRKFKENVNLLFLDITIEQSTGLRNDICRLRYDIRGVLLPHSLLFECLENALALSTGPVHHNVRHTVFSSRNGELLKHINLNFARIVHHFFLEDLWMIYTQDMFHQFTLSPHHANFNLLCSQINHKILCLLFMQYLGIWIHCLV